MGGSLEDGRDEVVIDERGDLWVGGRPRPFDERVILDEREIDLNDLVERSRDDPPDPRPTVA
jgi:hypothetical protein